MDSIHEDMNTENCLVYSLCLLTYLASARRSNVMANPWPPLGVVSGLSLLPIQRRGTYHC